MSRPAPSFSASTFSASVGGGDIFLGSKAASSAFAALRMSGSFSAWSVGMKLVSDSTRDTSGNDAGIAERGRQHLDRIRIVCRVAAEIEISRDRFCFWIAQIDRVEVETEPIEQRQTGDHHD